MDISRVRKFFGSCRRTEVLEMTGLERSPATLHGNDRVVKKGLRQLITMTMLTLRVHIVMVRQRE